MSRRKARHHQRLHVAAQRGAHMMNSHHTLVSLERCTTSRDQVAAHFSTVQLYLLLLQKHGWACARAMRVIAAPTCSRRVSLESR